MKRLSGLFIDHWQPHRVPGATIPDRETIVTLVPRDPPPLTTDGPNDDLQAATIELMHSIARLAVATFANDLVNKANDAHLYEFANIISDALHDYASPSR